MKTKNPLLYHDHIDIYAPSREKCQAKIRFYN